MCKDVCVCVFSCLSCVCSLLSRSLELYVCAWRFSGLHLCALVRVFSLARVGRKTKIMAVTNGMVLKLPAFWKDCKITVFLQCYGIGKILKCLRFLYSGGDLGSVVECSLLPDPRSASPRSPRLLAHLRACTHARTFCFLTKY